MDDENIPMDEENKPGALEKTVNTIQKAKQLKKTIEVLKNAKVLGPIIGAILPVIGWILLVLIIILAIVALIMLAMTYIEQIIDSGDKVINFLSGDGFLTSDSAYYKKLEKEYNKFDDYRNSEGQFDIALIAATTHFNKTIDPNSFFCNKEDEGCKKPEEGAEIKEDSEVVSSNDEFIDSEGAFKPVLDKFSQVNFYRIATYNVGNIGGDGTSKKLAGHLVDVKLTAGDTCYETPDNFFDFLFDAAAEIPTAISDFGNSLKLAFSDKIDDLNFIKNISTLVAYIMEGRFTEMVNLEWDDFKNTITDENFFVDMVRILKNSDFSNSKCDPETEYFFPKITYYINYERYKDYLIDVYLPNQPYAYCEKCEYKNASEKQKKIILENWYQQIMSIRNQYVSLFPSITKEKNTLSFTCPNGVTIKDKDGNIVVSNLDLEEYVKGVVAAENPGAPLESMKAQAVAARTYLLYTTNFCETDIVSSSNAQNYKSAPEGGYSSEIETAVNDTKGEVLLNASGTLFKSEYDAFCALEDCNNSDTCNAQYQRVPSSGFQTFSIPSNQIGESSYKNICYDVIVNKGECNLNAENQEKCEQIYKHENGEGDGGHGRGMSQEYANYLATVEGGNKNYKDMLLFFYGDGVNIGNVGLFFAGLKNIEETPSTEFYYNSKDDINRCGSDMYTFYRDNKESLNYQVASYVGNDYGTRNGPVMAAYFLAGEIRLQGYVLPYYYGGGHGNFPVEGVNGNWGSTCIVMSANTDKQPNGQLFNFGLDCSSFVSWSLYNGGFNQNTVNANTLAYLGSGPIAWNEGSPSAQAGDLAVTWYTKSNDYGHVGIIISVDEDFIWIAHEAGATRGLIIQRYPKVRAGTGFSHIVLMDSYYNNEANKR